MRARDGRRKGQALVEFALVIPVLLLFMLAITDFARGIFIYSVISDAAREGARYAIVHGSLATADGEQASGPGTSDASGTYVVSAAKTYAYGLNANLLNVGVCWGYGCTIASDCSSSTNTAKAPGVDIPVTVRTCYSFEAVTAPFLGVGAIPLSAQATLAITH